MQIYPIRNNRFSMDGAKKRKIIIIGASVAIIVLFAGAAFVFLRNKEKENSVLRKYDSQVAEGIDIRVFSPKVNALTSSPLQITGEAKGWDRKDFFQ